MKTYRGKRDAQGEPTVTVFDGTEEKELDPRHDVRDHSPLGFEWGYYGSGPNQLGLAILCDCVGVEKAAMHYQDFTRHVIANLSPHEGWELSETDVKRVVPDR